MRRHLWWVLALVLVVAGVVVVLAAPTLPAQYGWTSLEPLGENADWVLSWGDVEGGTWLPLSVTPYQALGGALSTVGLLVLVFGLGFVLGRRRGRPTRP